jgi:hypothetical protein
MRDLTPHGWSEGLREVASGSVKWLEASDMDLSFGLEGLGSGGLKLMGSASASPSECSRSIHCSARWLLCIQISS